MDDFLKQEVEVVVEQEKESPTTSPGKEPTSPSRKTHRVTTIALISSLIGLIVDQSLNQPIPLIGGLKLQLPLWMAIPLFVINFLLLVEQFLTHIHHRWFDFYRLDPERIKHRIKREQALIALRQTLIQGERAKTNQQRTLREEKARRKREEREDKEAEKRRIAEEKEVRKLEKKQSKQKGKPAPNKPLPRPPSQPSTTETKPNDVSGQHPAHSPVDDPEQYPMPPPAEAPNEHSTQSAMRVSPQRQATSIPVVPYPQPDQPQQTPPTVEAPAEGPGRRYDSSYQKTYQGHEYPVTALLWLPGTASITFACDDKSVWYWEPDNKSSALRLGAPTFPITSLAWSTQVGQTIIAYGKRHEMVLWGSVSAEVAYFHGHHDQDVTALAISPDGKYLASGGADRLIHICSLEQGHILYTTYRGHGAPIRDIVWSPQGDFIASTDENNYLLVWSPHAGGGNTIPVTQYQGHHQHCKVAAEQQGGRPKQGVSALAWGPEGRRIASAGALDHHVHVWNLFSGSAEGFFPHDEQVGVITWEPQGRYFAAATRDGPVSIWDSVEKKRVSTYRGHIQEVTHLAWARDGRIATASKDLTIRIWVPENIV